MPFTRRVRGGKLAGALLCTGLPAFAMSPVAPFAPDGLAAVKAIED